MSDKSNKDDLKKSNDGTTPKPGVNIKPKRVGTPKPGVSIRPKT